MLRRGRLVRAEFADGKVQFFEGERGAERAVREEFPIEGERGAERMVREEG